MTIINLTQHAASPEQLAAGVFEPADKVAVSKLLTFTSPPTWDEMDRRADDLAEIAVSAGADGAMIGGHGRSPRFRALHDAWRAEMARLASVDFVMD